MSISIRRTIRALVAPEHCLSCPPRLWRELLVELCRRGEERRESGAFLLGKEHGGRQSVERVMYYDDLDPRCLDHGIIEFDGAGYDPLWRLCGDAGLRVVADVHTHPGKPFQSEADRTSPMVAQAGHVALIVPDFAKNMAHPSQLGIYQYCGQHRWHDRSGPRADRFLYIGFWS